MKDRITVLLGAGAIVVAIVGGTCSTNARISDLAARIDRLDARVSGRLDGLDARLRAVEVALAKLEQRFTALEQLLPPTRAGDD